MTKKKKKTDTAQVDVERFKLKSFEFKSGYALLFVTLLLLIGHAVSAQFKVYPLPKVSQGTATKSKTKTNARTQDLVPRSLPFWDDFSWTQINKPGDTLANYPVDSLWAHNYSVLINNGLGLNPPSINVATFNGLASNNLPYSEQTISKGFGDTLTSQPLKLNEVLPAERNTVYLSFFYQWHGNGEPPDPGDFLRVEFKNDAGAWENVLTITTSNSFKSNEFYDTLVQVSGDRFFHESFQFRFMNYGRISGPFDTWNLDYVYLNKGRNSNDRFLPDRTITSSLTALFNGYTAMPYDHFLAAVNDPLSAHPQFDVFNVRNDTATLSYVTSATFTHYKDSAVSHVEKIDELGNDGTSPIDGLTGIIYARERKTVTLEHVPDRSDALQFDPDADSVSVSLKVQLFTGDTFDPNTSPPVFANNYDPAKYRPLDFRSNDTLRANYRLHNYYAYDDGSADYAVTLTNPSNRAAYLFELATDEPDTLIGFDIYYPDYGISPNLTVDFTVYDDNGGIPGVPIYTLPSYAIRKYGLNNFQKIRFGEQFLVEKNFYIGWKGTVGGTFKVGLDTNNDSASKLFVFINGAWYPNTDFTGSLMIRPVFGKGTIVTGIEEDEVSAQIYPNPNEGSFFVPTSFRILQINNVTGQSIAFSTEEQGENQRVSLGTSAPGLYLIRLQKGNQIFSSKIVIR
jgi:hypothetical protein